MREIDNMAMKAKSEPSFREEFLHQNEAYIIKCASKVCKRYISKSDDEWSISLIAYSQAIDSYDLSKGSFVSFSELVIKRRLIDYIKSQRKYQPELSVDPIIFSTEPEEDTEVFQVQSEVAKQISKQETNDIKYEIQAVSKAFEPYGFTFMDLSSCSPHAGKTRTACAKAINYILNNPILLNELHQTKQLPMKIIEINTLIPRKILERHRKYIIAATEILSGEYPILAEYMYYIRKESE